MALKNLGEKVETLVGLCRPELDCYNLFLYNSFVIRAPEFSFWLLVSSQKVK